MKEEETAQSTLGPEGETPAEAFPAGDQARSLLELDRHFIFLAAKSPSPVESFISGIPVDTPTHIHMFIYIYILYI